MNTLTSFLTPLLDWRRMLIAIAGGLLGVLTAKFVFHFGVGFIGRGEPRPRVRSAILRNVLQSVAFAVGMLSVIAYGVARGEKFSEFFEFLVGGFLHEMTGRVLGPERRTISASRPPAGSPPATDT